LQTIVNQEILLTEKYTTTGRRARNIMRVTVADIAKMRKEKTREERENEKENKRGKGRGGGGGRGRVQGEEEGEEKENLKK
jgi:hypothetical protein